jgi:hypothetical protein
MTDEIRRLIEKHPPIPTAELKRRLGEAMGIHLIAEQSNDPEDLICEVSACVLIALLSDLVEHRSGMKTPTPKQQKRANKDWMDFMTHLTKKDDDDEAARGKRSAKDGPLIPKHLTTDHNARLTC